MIGNTIKSFFVAALDGEIKNNVIKGVELFDKGTNTFKYRTMAEENR